MRIERLAEARSAHGAGRARRWRAAALALLLGAGLPRLRAQSADTPPPVPRELRAVWIATVGNIDWPSRPGLDAAAQQRELLTLLDRAVALHLNTVIFQVRPQADAVYASALEPWSPFLTGAMGRPPSPFYDPLAFLVREAHARGLAVHAWINPYRALHPASPGPPAATHVSRRAPALVRRYGRYLWMDPGDPAVREAVRRVVVDIVRRYDVDGIHIDDYFYPYPERDAAGRVIAFPDDSAWAAFRAGGGMLDRADWRRQNVDALVLELSDAVHRTKPFVLFGVSPFGIWRPGHPPGVTGFDAYEAIYANSRRWLRRGWVDYLAPQLYWPIEQPGQSYPALLAWWAAQNPARRHLWPGLNASLAARMPPGGARERGAAGPDRAHPRHGRRIGRDLLQHAHTDAGPRLARRAARARGVCGAGARPRLAVARRAEAAGARRARRA